MAGISTGVSLLQIHAGVTPRTLSYSAPTSTTQPLTSGETQYGRVMLTDGRTYTRKDGAVVSIDGTWASPVSNPLNPEGFSYRWVNQAGIPLSTAFGSSGVWVDASNVLICEMTSIPAGSGSYTSTFLFEVRNSSLTTIVSTSITITATRP